MLQVFHIEHLSHTPWKTEVFAVVQLGSIENVVAMSQYSKLRSMQKCTPV